MNAKVFRKCSNTYFMLQKSMIIIIIIINQAQFGFDASLSNTIL